MEITEVEKLKNQILKGIYVDLRPITIHDAANIVFWRNSPRVKFLHPGATTTTEQEEWITNRPSNELNYMIDLKSGESIGMYSIYKIDKTNMNAETGRLVISEAEKTRNLPAAFEAISLINDLAFVKLELKKIYGTVAEENSGALKLQKLIGMKEEGRLRKHAFVNGKLQDIIYFGLLADEYFNVQIKKLRNLVNLLH